MKICPKCKIEKENIEYSPSDINRSGGRCKLCNKEYNHNRYLNNINIILHKNKQYYNDNRLSIIENIKIYTNNNLDKIKTYQQKYHKDNKEIVLKKQNKNEKLRRQSDPIFSLKKNISATIRIYLKTNNRSKNRSKLLDYVPWTLEELKNHIEYHFSLPGNEWMSWNNQGVYRLSSWDDNNTLTWKWNLDHIIPHSKFNYKTMDSEEFRDCWSLSNLRPYSAKLNILDGNRR